MFSATKTKQIPKKKISNENQPLSQRVWDPQVSLSAAPVRCVKCGPAARTPPQQIHNVKSFRRDGVIYFRNTLLTTATADTDM